MVKYHQEDQFLRNSVNMSAYILFLSCMWLKLFDSTAERCENSRNVFFYSFNCFRYFIK